MNSYDLIFSTRKSYLNKRKIIFWSAFLLYFFYVNLLPASPSDLLNRKTYLNSLQLMIFFPVSIIAVLIAIKILLPEYIYPGRYTKLLLSLTCLTLFYFTLAWLITIPFAALTQHLAYHQLPVSFRWFLPVRYGIGFPLTSTVLICILKLLKNYYREQKENEKLIRQKINTELQLLKTRFQPQFLYNTLQNLLLLMKDQSDASPSILLKLSDLLSYILYENEKPFVLLQKELDIVKSYLILKKTFYPDELSIQFHQQINTDHLGISPLLLLPIVEIFLDDIQRTGKQQIIINLNIKTINKELHFQLECKRNNISDLIDNDPELKFQNAIKRLELLYADSNSFELFSENDTAYLMLILHLSEYSEYSVIHNSIEIPVLT